MRNVIGIIGFILYLGAGLAGVAVHLWTCLLFLGNMGWIAAVLAFCLPGLGEMFMAGITISDNGLLNTYTLSLVGIAVLYGLGVLCCMFSTEEETNASQKVC